jgi:hypothetical protein
MSTGVTSFRVKVAWIWKWYHFRSTKAENVWSVITSFSKFHHVVEIRFGDNLLYTFLPSGMRRVAKQTELRLRLTLTALSHPSSLPSCNFFNLRSQICCFSPSHFYPSNSVYLTKEITMNLNIISPDITSSMFLCKNIQLFYCFSEAVASLIPGDFFILYLVMKNVYFIYGIRSATSMRRCFSLNAPQYNIDSDYWPWRSDGAVEHQFQGKFPACNRAYKAWISSQHSFCYVPLSKAAESHNTLGRTRQQLNCRLHEYVCQVAHRTHIVIISKNWQWNHGSVGFDVNTF